MKIFVNGEPVEVADGANLADVVAVHTRSVAGVAAAIGDDVIPRSEWAQSALAEGARVEIVTAAAGG